MDDQMDQMDQNSRVPFASNNLFKSATRVSPTI